MDGRWTNGKRLLYKRRRRNDFQHTSNIICFKARQERSGKWWYYKIGWAWNIGKIFNRMHNFYNYNFYERLFLFDKIKIHIWQYSSLNPLLFSILVIWWFGAKAKQLNLPSWSFRPRQQDTQKCFQLGEIKIKMLYDGMLYSLCCWARMNITLIGIYMVCRL